jgi:hypothetical protein
MRRLYKNQYQFKIVIDCPGSRIFRSKVNKKPDFDSIERLLATTVYNPKPLQLSIWKYNHINTAADKEFALKFLRCLKGFKDIDLRVERYVSVYTNSYDDILELMDLCKNRVREIHKPEDGITLSPDTIRMPNVPFGYKVTLKSLKSNNETFVNWAKNNKNIRMTESSILQLNYPHLTYGKYFYVSDEKTLLLVKLQLGESIKKINTIIN